MRELLLFPHSHFCEKAVWGLDYKGLDYRKKFLFPGIHMMQVRRVAPQSSVPVLLEQVRVIQGAGEILGYLEEQYPERSLNPEQSVFSEALALEKRMDVELGEALRQIAYAYLLNYPDYCKACFVGHAPWWQRAMFQIFFPKLRKLLHKVYVKSDASVADAVVRATNAMTELDGRLASSSFLMGDRFTRVDLSVCAMLSIIVQPDEHPFDWPVQPSAELEALIAPLRERPSFQWAKGVYKEYRQVRV